MLVFVVDFLHVGLFAAIMPSTLRAKHSTLSQQPMVSLAGSELLTSVRYGFGALIIHHDG